MQISISSPSLVKTYYTLTKPGIIFGNALTAAAGFVLASRGHFDFQLLLATILGLSLIIASACVLNNYIDRHTDLLMARTQNRPLARGLVSVQNAILFAIVLAVSGSLLLAVYAGPLSLAIALMGFFIYVICYSLLKYRSSSATLIGSIAGAAPPVVGYCAGSSHLDQGAIILFFIVAFWQMPHFYAIALYRYDDYLAASIPLLPIRSGIPITKIHMLLYIIAFMIAAALLTVFGYTGYIYLAVATLLGLIWLWLSIKGFKATDNRQWGRKMFLYSLIVITVISGMIAVDTIVMVKNIS